MASNYESESVPFVLRDDALHCWPSLHWSLQDWADKCRETKLTYRVHRKNNQQGVDWENEAVTYVQATVAQFVEHLGSSGPSAKQSNPFGEFEPEHYCFYSSYNYMGKVFKQEQHKELLDSVRWQETPIGHPKLENNAGNSTLWMGTGGAYTPCHMDTYGYNFVAQLYGK